MTRGGVITAITYQKRDKTRASIFLDGEFAFGVFVITAERFSLRKGIELTVEQISEIERYDLAHKARRIAERAINRRRRSEFEIRKKLHDEDISDEIIEETVASLIHAGLINDSDFASAYIHDKLIAKSYSVRRLTADLKKLGIAKPIIESAINEAGLNETEESRALYTAEKKWQQILRRESDQKKRHQKLIAFLSSRGFTYDIIKRTVSQLAGSDEMEDSH
jgi:regulatory protein